MARRMARTDAAAERAYAASAYGLSDSSNAVSLDPGPEIIVLSRRGMTGIQGGRVKRGDGVTVDLTLYGGAWRAMPARSQYPDGKGKWNGVRGGERWYDPGGKRGIGLGRRARKWDTGTEGWKGGGGEYGLGRRGYPQDEWLRTRRVMPEAGDARWDLKWTGLGTPGPSGRCPLGPRNTFGIACCHTGAQGQ
eukprot:3784406-Rhodomonas_salina.2